MGWEDVAKDNREFAAFLKRDKEESERLKEIERKKDIIFNAASNIMLNINGGLSLDSLTENEIVILKEAYGDNVVDKLKSGKSFSIKRKK